MDSAAVLHAEPASDVAVRELARYAPSQVTGFPLDSTPVVEERDVDEIESTGGKIVLRGISGVVTSSAFYHYLKEFCHAHVSWNGDNLKLPASLPSVPEKNPRRFSCPVSVSKFKCAGLRQVFLSPKTLPAGWR